MQIYDYEMEFVKGVHQTYEMLKELDEVNNDAEFWKVYGNIKAGFVEIENARRSYYSELKKDGGDTQDCSLTHELTNGLYLLDEKYMAIWDTVLDVSVVQK
jgi:hypothetical protein